MTDFSKYGTPATGTTTATDFLKYGSVAPSLEQPQMSFADQAWNDIAKRGENVYNAINATDSNPLSQGIKATSEAFGGVTDVAGDAVRQIPGGGATLDSLKGLYGSALDYASRLPGISQLGDYLNKSPNVSKYVEPTLQTASDLGNISNTILMAKGVADTAKKGVNIASNIKNKVSSALEPIPSLPKDVQAQKVIDDAIRQTSGKYVNSTKVLSAAEQLDANPVDVFKAYGKEALPTINDRGAMETADAVQYLKGQIGKLGQLKQDMLFYQDNPTSFSDLRSYVNDLVDGQRGWTAAKKASVSAQVTKILNDMEGGYGVQKSKPVATPTQQPGIITWDDVVAQDKQPAPILESNSLPLQELDKIKTEQAGLSKSYKGKPGDNFEYDAHSIVGKAAQHIVDMLSSDETHIAGLNKWMQKHYEAIKLLKTFEGKTPQGGQLTRALTNLAGEGAGAVVGSSIGHPVLGMFGGRMIAQQVNNILTSDFIPNPLKRSLLESLQPQDPAIVKQALQYLDNQESNIQLEPLSATPHVENKK